MRKILLISTLVLALSACGLKPTSDFSSLYNKHVHSQIVAIEDIAKSLGLYKQEQSVGTLRAAVNVPIMMSGSLSLEHSAKVNGRDADLMLKNLRVAYESMMGSGSLSLDQLGMISKNGDVYVFFDGLADTILPEDIRSVMTKYSKTWLSWTQADIKKSLSGATEDEMIANTIIENLSKMTLDDVEKYLTKYQIFKQTNDLGMSGSLHVFAVDLDREATLALVTSLTEKLTGSGVSDADKKDIQEGLANIILSGTIAFDPSNARITETHLAISESGSSEVGTIDAVTTNDKLQVRLTSAATKAGVELVLAKEENKNTIKLIVSEGGAEMGKLVGYIQKSNDKFQELALDVTAQGMTVSLKHTMKDDGKFEGTLQLPIVGAITWNGTLAGKKLTGLSLKGTTPSGAISMELAPQGDRVVGPLTVKQGSETLLSATVGLLLDEGKFGTSIDILAPDSSESQAHFELDATNKTSPFTDSISIPSGVKPLQNLLDELEALTPKDSFVPVEDDTMYIDDSVSSDDMNALMDPTGNN